MNFEEGKLFTSIENGITAVYTYTNGELIKFEPTEQLNITEYERDSLLELYETGEYIGLSSEKYDKLLKLRGKLRNMFYNDDLL